MPCSPMALLLSMPFARTHACTNELIKPCCVTGPTRPPAAQPEDANYTTVHAFCSSNLNPRLTSYQEVHSKDVREEYEG